MEYRVSLLGSFEVTREADGASIEWNRKQTELLFKLLASERGKTFSQDQLIDLLFPRLTVEKALPNLQKRVSELRKILEPDRPRTQPSRYIESPTKGYYRFAKEAPCWIDIEELEQSFQNAQSSLANSNIPDALESFQQALLLYKGDFLEQDLYEDWTQAPRARFGDQHIKSWLGAAECSLQLGQYEQTIQQCLKAIEIAPGSESAYSIKMRAHYFLEESQEALATYEQCEADLKLELGLTPSPELHDLYVQILNGSLERPRAKTPNNLRESLTLFVGRTHERQEIHEHLNERHCRLLTVLGPGGMGKSRITHQVAIERLGQHPDGIYWVELAPLNDGNQMIDAIGAAVGLQFSAQTQPLAQLATYLADLNILIVLDNFEHMTEHALVLHEILENTGQTKMLVSSREPLMLMGERLYDLGGLSLPNTTSSSEPDTDSDAMKLFCESAARYDPTFEPDDESRVHINNICHLIEGSPLAIELASSWIRTVPLERMTEEIQQNINFLETRMRNVPERHRSMGAVFASTWDRLTESERDTFQKLSVFSGGFTLEAAEHVASASPQQLEALMNRSLVHKDQSGRYAVHELLRQFGRVKLEDSDLHQEMRKRHFNYFIQFAKYAEEEGYRGTEVKETMEILNCEQGNIRAALQWSLDAERYSDGAELCGYLGFYWDSSGLSGEGRSWIEQFNIGSDAIPAAIRAEALRWSGLLAARQGDYVAADEALTESSEIFESINDKRGNAYALMVMSGIKHELSKHETANEIITDCIGQFRNLDDPMGLAKALNIQGIVLKALEDLTGSVKAFEEVLELTRKHEMTEMMLRVTSNLAYVKSMMGDHRSAVNDLREAEVLQREIGDVGSLINTLINLGGILLELDQRDEARAAMQEVIERGMELGQKFNVVLTSKDLGWLELIEGNIEEALRVLEMGLQLALETNNEGQALLLRGSLIIALCEAQKLPEATRIATQIVESSEEIIESTKVRSLLSFAVLLASSGQFEYAAKIFGSLPRDDKGLRIYMRWAYDKYCELAREALDPSQYENAVSEGESLGPEKLYEWAKREIDWELLSEYSK